MQRRHIQLVGVGLGMLLWAACGQAMAGDNRGFGDWFVACEGIRCAATHETDLVEVEVMFEAGRDPRILLHVAREARVGDPIAVRLEDGEHAHLKVNRCAESHCTGEAAYARIAPEVVAEIKESKGALIAYLVGDVIIIAPISFEGYAEASAYAREKTGQ